MQRSPTTPRGGFQDDQRAEKILSFMRIGILVHLFCPGKGNSTKKGETRQEENYENIGRFGLKIGATRRSYDLAREFCLRHGTLQRGESLRASKAHCKARAVAKASAAHW
jgi:hypothetical protein